MTSVIAGIVLLCVLVVVHELGHFLVAKALGVKVLTFSVGFGPKLIKWTRGGTEYCLSAIPLGGYIKMVGESPTDELSEEEKSVSFLYQPLWKKSAIAIAGPLFNLVLPIILFFFVFLGKEQILLPVVGTTIANEPAAVAGILPGDRILSVDGVKVETFNDVIREVSPKPAQKVAFEIERKNDGVVQQKKIDVLTTASPDPNPVNIGEQVGRIGIMPAVKRAKIAILDPGSAAAKAGLKTFDEVTALNGKVVPSFDELELQLVAQKQPFKVNVQRVESDGTKKDLEITVDPSSQSKAPLVVEPEIQRFAVIESELAEPSAVASQAQTKKVLQSLFNDRQKTFGIRFNDAIIAGIKENSAAAKAGLKAADAIVSVNGEAVESWHQIQRVFEAKPDDMHILGVVSEGKARIVALRLSLDDEKGAAFKGPPKKVLGAVIDESYKQGLTAERTVGALAAMGRGLQSTWDLIKLTAKSLLLLFSFAVPVTQIGGPIMIFNVAGEAATQGVEYYIFVMSLVSVNLGLLNLLPIPVLDGGHLMMFFIEFVTRRPLTLRARQIATQIGLAFVLGLMLIAVFNDIARIAN